MALMKISKIVGVIALFATGCAGSNKFVRPNVEFSPEWEVSLCHQRGAFGIAGRLVRVDGSHWKFEPGVAGPERIVVDARRHHVCLDVPYPKVGTCPQGLLGLGGSEFNACESELTACAIEPLSVIAFPISALFLTYLCYPEVGSRFIAALQESNAIMSAYRYDYSHTSSAEGLSAFAEKYANDDPDHLVPLARAKAAALNQANERAQAAYRAHAEATRQQAAELEAQMRVEESRTGQCHPFHTEEFEKLLGVLGSAKGVIPEVKRTLVATAKGSPSVATLGRGGTYHAIVMGRGLQSVSWRDAHGDAITRESELFEHHLTSDWFVETRQFVAGSGDRLKLDLAGNGCALLLVARADSTAAKEESGVDSEGRTLMRGPIVGVQNLRRVHIVSDSVGVIQEDKLPMQIEDSVISAPVCVRTLGLYGLKLIDNTLDCDLGVEFRLFVTIGEAVYAA